MKKTLLLFFLLSLIFNVNAQLTDDMENYSEGATIFTGHWTDWNATGNTALFSSSVQANSGVLSGYIPPNGTTDALLNLGNKTTGQWGIKFMMYVPSGKEADLNIQSNIPVSSGYHAVGDIYFNKDNNTSGVGYVKYNSGVSSEWSYFNFPHDEWFEVIMNIHINNNWQLLINGNIEIDWEHYGRWIGDGQFEYTNALGGLNFWSRNSNCEYWVDDFDFINGFHSSTLSVNNIEIDPKIVLFPNPTSEKLFIVTNKSAASLQIISFTGQVVLNQKIDSNKSVDVSQLDKGIYFVNIRDGESINITKKLIIK